MDNEKLTEILNNVKNGNINVESAKELFKDLPFKDLGFVKLDNHRELRKGFGEVIYCKSKTISELKAIAQALHDKTTLIYTRVGKNKSAMLLSVDSKLEYNERAQIVYKYDKSKEKKGQIAIVAAGTSDLKVAEEARITAEVMGNNVKTFYDVGVAGIHRLFAVLPELEKSKVIIAVAGMEGALPSVISGLLKAPVIAVPTSVGYGANFGGLAALLTMINSCSPGIVTVNIDNGFGAGYFASLINK